jgi:membrane protease YdiL (CAAX protease family)
MGEGLIALLIVLSMSIALAVSGIKKTPGIGILLSLAGIIAAILFGHTSLSGIGFVPQENWLQTVILSLLLGVGIAVLGIVLIDPLAEKLTGIPHDYSIVDGVRGNIKGLLTTILLIWVTVAFMEEILFRGFLMTELVKVLGIRTLALTTNIIIVSVVFGLSHWYQGKSGVISSGLIGVLISLIFIYSSFNLWLVILVHGFIDTTYLVLMYGEWDRRMHDLFWKS